MDISATALDQFNEQIDEAIQPTAPRTVENEAGEEVLSREYKEQGLDRFRVFDGHRACNYYEPLRLNVQWSPGVELQQRKPKAPQFFNVLDEYERLTKLLSQLKDQVIKYKLDVLFQFKEFDAQEFQRLAQRLEKLKNKITVLVLYIVQQRLPRTVGTTATATATATSPGSVDSASSPRSSEASSVGSIADFVESDAEQEERVPLRELMRQVDSDSASSSGETPLLPSNAHPHANLSFDELLKLINELLVKIKNIAKTELDDQGIAELVELQKDRTHALNQLMIRKYKYNHVETPQGWFKVATASAEDEQRLIEQQAAMQAEGAFTESETQGEDIFAADSPVGGTVRHREATRQNDTVRQQQRGGYLIQVDGQQAQETGCDPRVKYEDVNLQYAWIIIQPKHVLEVCRFQSLFAEFSSGSFVCVFVHAQSYRHCRVPYARNSR